MRVRSWNRGRPSYGYLDPGTGTMISQLLVAVVSGAALTLKLSWGRVKHLFRRTSTKDPTAED